MSDQPDLFDAKRSRGRRDAALADVERSAGTWFERAQAAIKALPYGWEGLGEDIREKLLTDPDVGPAHHPNVWGAVIRTAISRKALAYTGRMRASRSVKAHARQQPILRRIP